MNALSAKFKEVLSTVLPITIIVLILHFTLTPFEAPLLVRFLLGSFLIILGLAIFLFGVDLGITPIGSMLGETLAKTNKIKVVIVAGLLLGFMISIAEPDLHVLAGQVDMVTAGQIPKMAIVVVVSLGIALMLAVGFIRTLYNFALSKVFSIAYTVIFFLSLYTSPEFLAIAFDSSGATTGALTVPFVLALALGISSLNKDSLASESGSFGLVGIISAGPIIAVTLTSILSNTDRIVGSLTLAITESTSLLAPFLAKLPPNAWDSFLALFPLLLLFHFGDKFIFKLPKKAAHRILKGLLYTFIGLVLFLTGVQAGFLEVGILAGYRLASLSQPLVVFIGLVLGLVTVIAEPAVYVLTTQIEEVTSGYVKRKVVLVALSIGVGLAVALSILRIITPAIQLWHYLLPGFFLAILLTHFVPELFVGIAFDAGGVASGPMTATFILSFAQGVAEATEGANVFLDGFGVIAMVALTPLITLQLLGYIYKVKSAQGGVDPNG
ncbi:MAG: DUF1538 domain-containing protein [Firmicutes bacterium]|nr:DUF1538 domain-containing protein [Bacillota bacterium]